MAKKKRQGEPLNGNSDGSSGSSEDIRNTFSDCTHVNKSVDLSRVKKLLQRTGRLNTECEQCKNSPDGDDAAGASPMDEASDFIIEVDDSLWMCLQCGHQACGRYKKKHALHHFNTPHSDSHCLCLNTTKWTTWCYSCDNEVNISGKKKLHECVEYIKKFVDGGKKAFNSTPNNIRDFRGELIEPQTQLAIIADKNQSDFVARGLNNLGNTCFFNSVMQCLGQTPYFLKLLEETAISGQQFKLPGGEVVIDNKTKATKMLDPLEGILEEWKPLTRALADTIRELQNGSPYTYNPSTLFRCLTQRMTMFGGGDQHDSHELLRHLLDAVREEDLRRYQSVILKHLGFSTKTDPSTVEGEKRTIIRFYGSQASELLLPTEQVFRGVLVSTLKCQDCGHTSHREEYFLDLSLPISEKQRPPVLRRKAEDSDDHKPSKHQIKKERRTQRKNNKRGYGFSPATSSNHTLKDTVDSNGDVPMESESNDKSDSQSDADVEDNIEESSNSPRTSKGNKVAQTESGYNSDKHSPDHADQVASPAVGMLSASPFTPDSPATSPASSETNIDLESPACGQNSPTQDGVEEFERPESRLAFVGNKNNDLKADLEKLSLINEIQKPDGAYGGAAHSAGDNSDEDLDLRVEENDDEQMEVDDEMYSGTISMPSIEDGECSVQSCLNQFTTAELMTNNNKVRCELCSKRYGGPEKKTVLTNATKQLLIYNPPAVLILHLKRFQVCHFRPSKISRNVKFPALLDIAPFCSKRSRDLPTFDRDQKQVLYSLYGVVEHNGYIHGGHYVAYVKVRSKITDDNYRWSFLPKNHRNMVNKNVDPNNLGPGRWYYISDSHAAEVTEDRVLNASAYLLFYERIL